MLDADHLGPEMGVWTNQMKHSADKAVLEQNKLKPGLSSPVLLGGMFSVAAAMFSRITFVCL